MKKNFVTINNYFMPQAVIASPFNQGVKWYGNGTKRRSGDIDLG